MGDQMRTRDYHLLSDALIKERVSIPAGQYECYDRLVAAIAVALANDSRFFDIHAFLIACGVEHGRRRDDTSR